MILVAIAMLSMLAMPALAIDVITLYSARSETQSAADAAALAAAKMLVDSGVPLASGGDACPSCTAGASTFQTDLECCNPTPLSCGATAPPLPLDTTVFPEGAAGPAQSGVECLIHKAPGNGQDILNQTALPGALTYPLQIQAGGNHPLAGTSLNANDFITSSGSLITVPVYDPAPGVPPVGPVQIIGFLQLFIVDSFSGGGPKAGEFTVTVVNVSGCGSSATGTPVYGSGVSGIPVRLIQ